MVSRCLCDDVARSASDGNGERRQRIGFLRGLR